MDENKFLDDIENLRNKLHDKVGNKEINDTEILKDEELIKISNKLDELILKYMTQK